MAFEKDSEAKLNIVKITDDIKRSVENTYNKQYIEAIGEVVGYKVYSGGHAYFTLKEGDASLFATFFKYYRETGLRIIDETGRKREPKDGEIVKVIGKISIYSPNSTYQIKAESIELANKDKGMFAKTYEETLKKLIAEHILSLNENTNVYTRINPPIKKLPKYPRKVAVLTAREGAVINDFKATTKEKHGLYEIDLYNIHVQNVIYAQEIADALKLADSKGIYDVIVLMRGGGSKEDLSLFNSYIIAKAIISLKCPVLVSTGHENDVTIAELVADKRAGTPTLAATILCEHYSKVDILIDKLHENIMHHMDSYKTKLNMYLDVKIASLEKFSPNNIVKNKSLEIEKNINLLCSIISKIIDLHKNNVNKMTYTLSKYDPSHIMSKYKVVVSNHDRSLKQNINLYVADLTRRVDELEKKIVTHTKNRIDYIKNINSNLIQKLNYKNPNILLENYRIKIQSLEKQLKPLINSIETKCILESDKVIGAFKKIVVDYVYNLNSKHSMLTSKLNLLDPNNILNRGYTIVSQNGKAVSSISNLNIGDVEIKFKDGLAYGEINSIDSQSLKEQDKSKK